eukprot:1373230-Prymnesium_polylepis.2
MPETDCSRDKHRHRRLKNVEERRGEDRDVDVLPREREEESAQSDSAAIVSTRASAEPAAWVEQHLLLRCAAETCRVLLLLPVLTRYGRLSHPAGNIPKRTNKL